MIAKFGCLQKVRSRLVVTVEAVNKYKGGVDEIFRSLAAAQALKLRHDWLDLPLNLGFTMTYAGNYGSPASRHIEDQPACDRDSGVHKHLYAAI